MNTKTNFDKWKGKRYSADGPGYWCVVGLIEDPALILKNPVTGETCTEVIDCQNHQNREEFSDQDALESAENALYSK